MTLFQKEMLENWRNKKWIWVPLVFILLAIMDPLTTYYMPQILDAVGGLPEGAILEFPDFSTGEVIMMSLSQLSSLGVLIIVLISMAVIAGERKSGVSELILVKPVSYSNYITAKWTALLLLVLVSFTVGMLGSWYYINILFGELSFKEFLSIVVFYGSWLTLVVSVLIFYNTLVKTPGLVAFLSILTIMSMSAITQVFNHVLEWSPNNISSYILVMLESGEIPSELIGATVVAIVLSIGLLIGSVFVFQSKELAN